MQGPILHTGWLVKKAVRTASKDDWKRRWFVLADTQLSYFESDASKWPKNTLRVTADTRVRLCDLHMPNELEVFFGDQTLYAAADTLELAEAWIQNIQDAINACGPPPDERALAARELADVIAAARSSMHHAWEIERASRHDFVLSVSTAAEARSVELRELRRVRRPDLLSTPTAPSGKGRSLRSLLQTDKKSSISLHVWGLGDSGQCADERVLPQGSSIPLLVETLRSKIIVNEFAVGGKHVAVVLSDGRLITWGDNSACQLGMPLSKAVFRAKPTLVAALQRMSVAHVACGYSHTLAVTSGGLLWAWGSGPAGQLGLGAALHVTHEPQRIAIPSATDRFASFSKVYAGKYTSAAISTASSLFMWGSNSHGQLGTDVTTNDVIWQPQRQHALGDDSVRHVALGDTFSAFLVNGDQLMVCGALGVTRTEWAERRACLQWPRYTAYFGDKSIVTDIAAAGGQLCILSQNSLYTCGYGWLGGPTKGCDISEEPVAVSSLDYEGVAHVDCGPRHTVATCRDGRLFVFGDNSHGALGCGHNTSVNHPIPAMAMQGQRVVAVRCGYDFCMALTTCGAVTTPLMGSSTDAYSDAITLPEASLMKQKLVYRHTWDTPTTIAATTTRSEPIHEERRVEKDETWSPARSTVFAAKVAEEPPPLPEGVPPTFVLPPPPSFRSESHLVTPRNVAYSGISEEDATALSNNTTSTSVKFKAIAAEDTAAVAAHADVVLPAGWARFVDDHGDPYYYCEELGDTTWLLFWELADADGTPYFMNCETRETQWDKPNDAVIVVAK